jgi:lauroyl/myristoyl acyltransferase
MTSVIDAAVSTPAGRPDDAALLAPRPVPWGGVVARARASVRLRRLVPAPVAMAALDLAQWLAVRRNPARLDAARAAIDAVVGGTPREADAERLAFRHLCAWSHGWELMWRPWLLRGMPVVGAEHLAGIEAGRGILFTTPHFGPLVGTAQLPALVGGPVHAAVGDHLVAAELPRGYNGYQTEQLRRLLRDCGFAPVRALGSARTFTRVLENGGRVLLNLDVPGKTPVRFLGKPVELMSGTGKLAMSTDSVVVPVVPLPHGRRWRLHLGAPLDPREFDTWDELLQTAVTAVEELVLQAPEYLETPLRDGGWAEATRDGWRR